jgi:hypothetical protein
MDERLGELTDWVSEHIQAMGLKTPHPDVPLSVVSGDASFRRYFRGYGYEGHTERTFIVMDAPPEKETSEAYVKIARALEACDLSVPHIHAANLDKGYLLLSDLGDELYLNHLNAASADHLYKMALEALLQLQQCDSLISELPSYNTSLLSAELHLFIEWFCDQLLHLSLDEQDQALIDKTFEKLIVSALAQPQVCVHRDYHSRNLMLTSEKSPGILDFQDAVKGPITYDLVSLLKDCYISWPRDQVEQWVISFANQLREKKWLTDISDEQFLRWFDWMGIQRHLKVLGIFSRLNLRDHKPRYLNDIALVFDYVLDATMRYNEFSEFHEWLKNKIQPAWQTFCKREAINS